MKGKSVILGCALALCLIGELCLPCLEAVQAGSPRFPIRIGETGRSFEDQDGKPVLIQGDSAWSLIAQLNLNDAEFYLEQRKSQGFNAVLVNLVERKFCNHPPRNIRGDSPFMAPGDFSSPNEAYFSHADTVLGMAAQRGMLVFLVPAYLGWGGGGEGWFQDIRAAGPEQLRSYGRYVGNRYKRYPNIVWVVGGDYTPPQRYRWCVDALAEGIREGGARQLMTAHCGREPAANAFGDRRWLDFNTVYSYENNLHADTLREYERRPARPFVLIEGIYEGEHLCTPQRVRSQAYWSLLTGAAGHFYGNNPVWNFDAPTRVFTADRPWKEAMNSQGARDMMRLRALWGTIPWHTLVPDAAHQFAVSGYGSVFTSGYSAAAVARDGATAIAYVAADAPGTLTIAAPAGSAILSAEWIDPSSGKRFPAAVKAGSQGRRSDVTIPGANGSGAKDWILHVQMRPRGAH